MKHLKYLSYLFRHKWYVGIECFKRHLYLETFTHDLSKFLPDEFIPYTNFFFGEKNQVEFDSAWLLHQKRNKHHWQWWVLQEDTGAVKAIEMSERARLEMVCDWIGAGKAQGHFSPKNMPLLETQNWWKENNHKMQLHPNTRDWIEKLLK